MHTTSPLSALRHWLEASQLDGMIVPRADAWQSEYCAPYDEKLRWQKGWQKTLRPERASVLTRC